MDKTKLLKTVLLTLAVLIAPLGLIAQTSNTTIDLTPLIGIITSILPIFMIFMVLMMLFRMLGGITESFGKIFALPLLLLIGQTTSTTPIDYTALTTTITSLITGILPIFIMLIVLMFIFKFIGQIPKMFNVFYVKLRAYALALLTSIMLLAQTSTPSLDQALNVLQSISPLLMTLISIVIVIALPLLIFKVLAKSVLDIIH